MLSAERIAAFFVEPVAGARDRPDGRDERPTPPAGPPAGVVGLLTSSADGGALGAAVALAAAGRGVGVVATWRCSGRGGPGAPGTGAAKRLATSLAARGLAVNASGRLVAVALDDDERSAVASLGPLEAATQGAPTVLVVGGPRGEGLDEALARCTIVHVHADPPELVALTVSRLREQGIPAAPLGPAPMGLARRLARSGLVVPGTAGKLRPRAAEAGP